ncbi:uncharacterized protein [Pyrus communis]|uniref:uncharacterized protein n=1 Tax=Pyrus communis TaxID=23211 RepID=UPI0035C07913
MSDSHAYSLSEKNFHLSDGGTIALDWLRNSDVMGGAFSTNNAIPKDDTTPIVKNLGEDGEKTPADWAVAICSPWDPLVSDRFIGRRLLQKFYDKALTIGLQGFAQLYVYSSLLIWSRSVRDFDQHTTCIVGKFEVVDTFYRRCTSATYVGNVAVPLLCISALDDPVCTREAIPWDECRANKNIVLATTKHGGHLVLFEGLTASGIWWVRAVDEYLKILHSSQYMHVQKYAAGYGPFLQINIVDLHAFQMKMEWQLPWEMNRRWTLEPQKIHYRVTNEMVSGEQDEGMIQAESHLFAEFPQSSEQVTSMQDAKPLDVTTTVGRCLDQLSQQTKWSLWLLVDARFT